MAHLIDISVPLSDELPIWPGSSGFQLERTHRMEDGAVANVSRLACDVHVGTHIDAPRHFVPDGKTVEQLPPNVLMGRARVAYLPNVDKITEATLSQLDESGIPERLLLRTDNSHLWSTKANEFQEDFTALTADAAQWIVDQGIRLVGIDYLSIQRYHDGPLTHQVLLENEVTILEGLNLSDVKPGDYQLICLPIPLKGAEAAPARAILTADTD